MPGCREPAFGPATHPCTVVGAALDELQAARDGLQHVVEVVRDAAGELADRGQAATLPETRVHVVVVGQRLRDLPQQVLVGLLALERHLARLQQRRRLPCQRLQRRALRGREFARTVSITQTVPSASPSGVTTGAPA